LWVTLHFQLVNDGCRTENSHMSEVRTSNISPARMIEDLAALPPLTRISYLEEHFKGLQIRIGGEITRLQDIGFPYATVGVKNKADGAQVLANFSKPLAVIAFLPDTPSSPAKIPRYSFLSHCIARPPLLSPSAAVHMIRKGQVRWVAGDDLLRQIQFIDSLFDLAA
jgi:hypothetical protein